MVHSGFTVYCSTNVTAPDFAATDADIVSHSILNSQIQQIYSAEVFLPVNCDVRIPSYSCAVAAFNEEGEGPRSPTVETLLPCDFTSKETV